MNKKIEKKPSICYETGLDEAFLVGTKDELLEFAQAIIELLSGPKEPLDYLGVKTEVPIKDRALTESMSEIVIDGMLVVESTEDRQELVNKIRINNGEPPIDWEGNGIP
jgi:hypothetical protein